MRLFLPIATRIRRSEVFLSDSCSWVPGWHDHEMITDDDLIFLDSGAGDMRTKIAGVAVHS